MKLTTNYKIGIGAGIAIACGLGYYFLVYKKNNPVIPASLPSQDAQPQDQQGGGGSGGGSGSGYVGGSNDLPPQTRELPIDTPVNTAPIGSAENPIAMQLQTVTTGGTPNIGNPTMWTTLANNIAAQNGGTTTPATPMTLASNLTPTLTATSGGGSQSLGAMKSAGAKKMSFKGMNKTTVAPRII